MGILDKATNALTGAADEKAGQQTEQIEGLAGNGPNPTDIAGDTAAPGPSAASTVQPAAAPESQP